MSPSKIQELRRYLLCVSCCLFLILIRSIHKIMDPMPWAEDGPIFWTQAMQMGLKSFFVSHGGYFHTIPRIIALIVVQFKVDVMALVNTLASIVFYVFLVSFIVLDSFSYLIKFYWQRLICAIAFCWMPGMQEIIGTPTNLHWVLSFFLCLFGMQKLECTQECWEWKLSIKNILHLFALIFLFMLCGSSGSLLVYTPLFVFRLYKTIQSKKSFLRGYDFWILVFIFIWTLLASFHSTGYVHDGLSNVFKIHSTVVNAFLKHTLILPVLGFSLTEKLSRHYALVWWSVAILVFSFVSRALLQDLKRSSLLIFGYVSTIMTLALMTIVRSEVLDLFASMHIHPGLIQLRYGYVLAGISFLLIFYACCLLYEKNKIYGKFSSVIFLSLYFSSQYSYFFLESYPDISWKERLHLARASQCNADVNYVKIRVPPAIREFYVEFSKDKICPL